MSHQPSSKLVLLSVYLLFFLFFERFKHLSLCHLSVLSIQRISLHFDSFVSEVLSESLSLSFVVSSSFFSHSLTLSSCRTFFVFFGWLCLRPNFSSAICVRRKKESFKGAEEIRNRSDVDFRKAVLIRRGSNLRLHRSVRASDRRGKADLDFQLLLLNHNIVFHPSQV